MKKLFILTLLLFIFLNLKTEAQILAPIKWSYAAKKTGPHDAVIFLKATIDQGWHIYSQSVADGGPVKTTISFAPNPSFTLVNKTIEPKPISRMEKAFGMTVSYFEHTVIFQQKVNLKNGQATIKGSVEYMTCNDEKCLPPTIEEFTIPVK